MAHAFFSEGILMDACIRFVQHVGTMRRVGEAHFCFEEITFIAHSLVKLILGCKFKVDVKCIGP